MSKGVTVSRGGGEQGFKLRRYNDCLLLTMLLFRDPWHQVVIQPDGTWERCDDESDEDGTRVLFCPFMYWGG